MKFDIDWTIFVRDTETGDIASLSGTNFGKTLAEMQADMIHNLGLGCAGLRQLADGPNEQPIGATVGGIC